MDVDSLVQQATDLARRGHFDEARDALRKAASMAPLRSDIREMLLDINDYANASGAPSVPVPPRSSAPSVRLPSSNTPPPRSAAPASPFARMATDGSAPQQPARPSSKRGSKRGSGLGEFYAPHRSGSSSWIFLWIGVAVLLVALAVGAGVFFKNFPVPGSKPQSAPAKTPVPKDPAESQRLELTTEVDKLMSEGKYEDALKTLDQLMATNPPKPEAYNDLRFKARFELGKAKWQRKEYKSALGDFEEAVQLNPKDSDALFYAGYMHYQVGQAQNKKESKSSYLDAEKFLNRAIAENPQNFKAYDSLARTYSKEGKTVEASEKYKKIIELAPPNSPESQNAQRQLKSMGVR